MEEGAHHPETAQEAAVGLEQAGLFPKVARLPSFAAGTRKARQASCDPENGTRDDLRIGERAGRTRRKAIPERRGPFKPPPKKPGKDQRLCAHIYMQVLSARVVQSEHRSRKLAERQIHLLKATLHDQLDNKIGTIRKIDDEDQMLTSVFPVKRPKTGRGLERRACDGQVAQSGSAQS